MKPFVIVQSASINPFQFAKYMFTDRIITISGARNPVGSIYLEELAACPGFDRNKINSIAYCASQAVIQILKATPESLVGKAIKENGVDPQGSILVFVPS